MGLEELRDASEILDDAATDCDDDDLRERIETQADNLTSLAARSRGPDHGRLARHMHALQDIVDDADGDVADRVQEAYDHVLAYRETVSGV